MECQINRTMKEFINIEKSLCLSPKPTYRGFHNDPVQGHPKAYQDHSQEKEMQKSKMAIWGGLTNSCEKKRSEKQSRKGKI